MESDSSEDDESMYSDDSVSLESNDSPIIPKASYKHGNKTAPGKSKTKPAEIQHSQHLDKAVQKKKLTRRRNDDNVITTSDTKTTQRSLHNRGSLSASDMILSQYSRGGDQIEIKGKNSRKNLNNSKKSRQRSRSVSAIRNSTTPNPVCENDAMSKEWANTDITILRDKMKTYKLRISGQLQTIRSLEVKLGETELELREKNIELTEMKRCRTNGFCCGAGGAQMFKEEEKGSRRINTERTEEAVATGASIVAAACPFCNTMLTDGIKTMEKEESVQVMDIAELVALSMQ